MSKVAVVFWTGTGNTQAMADKVADGAKAAGADVTVLGPSQFDAVAVSQYDAIAFGCPAMGAEVLEETEFQPMWDDVKGSLGSKKVALFGSWGWGGGVWMDDWKADADANGVNVVGTAIAANAPDADAEAECEALGRSLA